MGHARGTQPVEGLDRDQRSMWILTMAESSVIRVLSLLSHSEDSRGIG